MKRILIPVITGILLASCGTSAKIENRWRDPAVKVDMSKLNKILIVALVRNDVHRRAAETQLAEMLKGKGVASYSYFAGEFNAKNEETLKQKLKKDGFDGAVVMRLADVEKDVTYTGTAYPAYYGRFYPYLSNAWGAYYQPGYFSTTRKFTIETNVYSLKADKLIWSSLTSSVDPASAEKLMGAVSKEVYSKMKKDGFIEKE